jgi:L-alanine-DL-glutamate epimerase-like enolase superfamily enzyme
MRIVSYKLYESVVHCRRPFKIATGQQDACRTLILELVTASGVRAHGEAVPIPLLTDETLEGCRQTLVELLLPLLRHRDIWAVRDIHRDMLRLTRAKSARCAVDLALHYLQARCLGVSLARRLGTAEAHFETNYSIGIESLQDTLQLARDIVARGFRRIKLKVGLDPDRDIETVRKLSESLPDGLMLRLDANCGWDRLGAVKALRSMERHGCPVELVEQPTLREDFAGLRFVRERTGYPIAADESVQTIHDARQLLQDGCVDILNLKLMKSGGILPAMEIASMARAYGCRLMIGGMVGESFLGVQAAASVAALFGFEYADLDADILLRDAPFAEHHPGGPPLKSDPPYRRWELASEPSIPTLAPSAQLVEEWNAS